MNITLEKITKRYGRTTVLEDLCLAFPGGQLTALLGPSGCGKTTILNIISGVLQPDRGDVYFADRCMTDVHLSRRNIGYVFQNYALYPNMTAYKNLEFPLTNTPMPSMSRGEKKEYCDEQIRNIAKLLGIEDLLNRYPSELSGGQQQRVALGRALIRRPDILLMDEPFANLDRRLSIELREEVRQIQQQTGLTTIFVTHNQTDANAISDQIVLLNGGTVQQVGTPSQLYDRPKNLFAADFFGEYGSNILPRKLAEAYCPDLIAAWPAEATAAVFRPEDLNVSADTGGFSIRSSTRMGGSRLYHLQQGELHLTALTNVHLPADASVGVTLLPNRVNFYDHRDQLLSGSEVR